VSGEINDCGMSSNMTIERKLGWTARVMVDGIGQGKVLILPEPLSLWGGLDPQTGQIIDERHPSLGQNVTEKVLLLPVGRGSSSASSILLESVRVGTAPAAIVTAEPDGILALGAIVSRTLYDKAPPVVVLAAGDYGEVIKFVEAHPDILLRVAGELVEVI
jgi:predicted aconitase with swiveling domain